MCSTSTLKSKIQDPKRPVVCFDESPTQLIGEVRQPIKAEPGQLERYDCEYKRNGTANLFIFLDVHRPWRKVKVTDSRTTIDFAACITRRRLLSQSGARPRRAG
jgi:DDE superfamily endonuclease